MQVVPWIFGVAHPTGFPVFVIAAGIFAHVFAVGTVAWRIALFSAIAMSASAWLVYRLVCEVQGGDRWPAFGAALLFAFGEIAWTRGTRAEVHAAALFFALLALFALLRWYRRGEPSVLVAGGLAWGLGIATHPIVALLAPAVVLILVSRWRQTAFRSVVFALLAFLSGVAFYAYIPLRSAAVTAARLDPTLTLGDPPGGAFWDMDHPSTPRSFAKYISGADYGTPGAWRALVDGRTYAAHLPAYAETLLHECTPIGVLLALGGLVAVWRRDRVRAAAMLMAAAAPTIFAFGYTIESDIDRYYLISFAITAVFAGCGASAAARCLPALRPIPSVVIAAAAFALLFVNRATFAQRSSPGAQSVIQTVLHKTPGNAILLAPWMFATPLAYGSYVEHDLGSRIVDSTWLSDEASRVPEWMRRRPVYVVGILFGNVAGYRAVKIAGSPDLYRVVKQ